MEQTDLGRSGPELRTERWALRRWQAGSAWRNGYATEAARAVLTYAFDTIGLDEVVSITTRTNAPSRAVMQRLSMSYGPGDDFEYPLLPDRHPLRPSVVYRIARRDWTSRHVAPARANTANVRH